MVVALVSLKLAAVVVPNFTTVAPVRWVPVMVTVVPPVVEPKGGVTEVMVGGGAIKVKPVFVAVPPAVVANPVNLPATWALVLALTMVALTFVKLAAAVEPNFTAV